MTKPLSRGGRRLGQCSSGSLQLRIDLRIVSAVNHSDNDDTLPLIVDRTAQNSSGSQREHRLSFGRIFEAVDEVVSALHSISLRLPFVVDFNVAVVFAVVIYRDSFLAVRTVVVFCKPVAECVKVTDATIFIRHVISELLSHLIESAVCLSLLFFYIKCWLYLHPENVTFSAVQKYLTTFSQKSSRFGRYIPFALLATLVSKMAGMNANLAAVHRSAA